MCCVNQPQYLYIERSFRFQSELKIKDHLHFKALEKTPRDCWMDFLANRMPWYWA